MRCEEVHLSSRDFSIAVDAMRDTMDCSARVQCKAENCLDAEQQSACMRAGSPNRFVQELVTGESWVAIGLVGESYLFP